MSTIDLGKKGEDLAAAYLKQQKYKILERNYRVKHGEIDIIALDGKTLVFIEVKTKASDFFAPPSASVGFQKQQKVRHLAERYIAEKNLPESEVRFDVISIVAADKPQIEHIKNAF